MPFENIFLILLFIFSFIVFIVPARYKYYSALILVAVYSAISSVWSISVLTGSQGTLFIKNIALSDTIRLVITIDKLSSFFILVINLTCLAGLLFAGGYLKTYYSRKSSINISVHFFAYFLLYVSMLLVVTIREGLAFIIAWELMAIASFLLVIFDAEERHILKTGISYLVQMHAGMFLLLVAFIIMEKETGILGFDALEPYFSGRSGLPVFLLFFAGFGIKAGLIPLHTWLPEAHPAAPSHVSGVMSGVMIKMGIYGILRVVFALQNDLFTIGLIILIVSLLSGLFGVMMAIVQHDLKKLLAYHSIENIGIIGTGIGAGVIGLAYNNDLLVALGFGGGILHVLNHSLFKSLLFYSAGNVYQASHTRNIELLGGLMKNMPRTSLLFLLGSLAICGIPPLNGFISEYLLYAGMFKSITLLDFRGTVVIIMSIVGLTLIGGLAIFCFTKAFGITFLGEPRSRQAEGVVERGKDMIIPQLIPALFIIAIGLAPALFVKPVMSIVADSVSLTDFGRLSSSLAGNLNKISLISGIFIFTLTAVITIRYFHLKKVPVRYEPTWGCGYTSCNARMQYTSTSFAYNYNHLAKPVTGTKKYIEEIREEELFPGERKFESHTGDPVKDSVVDKPVEWSWFLLKKLAVMQTGRIQHYILYAFVFIMVALLLTYLNVI